MAFFAHPRCPCSRASVEEFERILPLTHSPVVAYVVFVRPPGVEEAWDQSPLWAAASRIPGVRVLRDPEGSEAKSFGAFTSGHVLLYDPQGSLLFSGGITAARGHAGENAGSGAVLDFLLTGSSRRSKAPVFGCSLLNSSTGG